MKTTGTKFADGTESKTGRAALEKTVTSTNRVDESIRVTNAIDRTLQQLANQHSTEQIRHYLDFRIGALLRVAGVDFSPVKPADEPSHLRFQFTGLSEVSRQAITQSVQTVLNDMLSGCESNDTPQRKRERHKVTLVDRNAATVPTDLVHQNNFATAACDIDRSAAAGLTHKLNNYLTAILSATEQLQEVVPGHPDSDQAILTGIILRAARTQQQLVDRFHKVFGSIQLHNEKCNLHLTFRAILGCLQESLHREVTYHGDNSQICAITDRKLIEQIVAELVLNATEATPDGPIDFRWQIVGGRLLITLKNSVNDSCVDLCTRIFEPFFTTKLGHSGLGLNIARRYSEALGGTIRPIITQEQVTLAVSLPIQLDDQTNSHTERNN